MRTYFTNASEVTPYLRLTIIQEKCLVEFTGRYLLTLRGWVVLHTTAFIIQPEMILQSIPKVFGSAFEPLSWVHNALCVNDTPNIFYFSNEIFVGVGGFTQTACLSHNEAHQFEIAPFGVFVFLKRCIWHTLTNYPI